MIDNTTRRRLSALALLGAALVAASDAHAGFSGINRRTGREAGHERILEQTYGGDFTATGRDFSNGRVDVTRVDDFDAAQTDERWDGATFRARAVAAFTGRARTFGAYQDAAQGGAFAPLLDTVGTGFDVAGTTDAPVKLGGTIRFGRGETVGRAFSSLASDNRDGRDHLVTYRVSGLDDPDPTYLLFWEDQFGRRSDFDYNDLVVEMSTDANPVLIPLPAAAWSGLSGLAGLGVLTGWKRARRWLV